LEAWRQALEAGVSEAGCTVHLVDSGVDTGKILGQSRVPVLPADTAATLHARIQVAEHELYPRIVREFSLGLSSR
jgi:phosphoribosylglycinamide formyltransferase-1